MALLSFVTVLGCLSLTAGCFSPSLDGTFACGTDPVCPPGLACAPDNVCRVGVDLASSMTDAAVTTAVDAAMPIQDQAMMMAHADLGCVPKTCGTECGTALDGCGATITCGTCGFGQTCGAKTPNLCGSGFCVAATCKTLNDECGLVSDGCSEVLNCGSCPGGKTCGAKTPNKCD